ncbi:unnamed protein product [Arctogadus glacialis]
MQLLLYLFESTLFNQISIQKSHRQDDITLTQTIAALQGSVLTFAPQGQPFIWEQLHNKVPNNDGIHLTN